MDRGKVLTVGRFEDPGPHGALCVPHAAIGEDLEASPLREGGRR